MDPAIPWYKSSILIGIIVSLLFKLLFVSGLVTEVAPGTERQVVDALLLVVSGAGDLWALRGRVVQTSAPVVTRSQAKANELIQASVEVAAVAVPLDAEQGAAIVPLSRPAAAEPGYAFGGQVEAIQQEQS